MPAHLKVWIARFGDAVDVAVQLTLAFRPERLPGEQFGILEQQSPEGDKGAVSRAISRGDLRIPVDRLTIALLRASNIDATVAGDGLAIRTETGDRLRRDWTLHQQIEGTRPFRAPRDPVEVVAFGVVLNDAKVPGAVIRIVEAESRGWSTPGVDFKTLREVRVATQLSRVAALLDPGDALHASRLGLGQHLSEDIPARMLRCPPGGAEHGATVILGMHRRIVAPHPIQVVLLCAMVGQWPPRQLTTASATGPRWSREEERVDTAAFLECVGDRRHALIDE